MPFKFHEPHRHRVPKARYRVRNWAEYDRGLVQRGDVRVWISAEALACWKAACRSTPGGQRRFSNLAVETVLVLGALYKLPLRQTEGFVRSLIELMRLELTVPDHTTLARRRRTIGGSPVAADFSTAEYMRKSVLLEHAEDRELVREGLIKAGLPA